MNRSLTLNGVAEDGSYVTPPIAADAALAMAMGRPRDTSMFVEQRLRHLARTRPTYAPRDGVDPKDLRQSGWAIVFHEDEDPAVIEALRPLIDHRMRQVGDDRLVRVLRGEAGYRSGESKQAFLRRQGAAPTGPADPASMPYYIVLVGEPGAIPFSVQYQLDVAYAVGRLDLDTAADYASYASSVVAAEANRERTAVRASFFATDHDEATELSANQLVRPLAATLASRTTAEVGSSIGAAATTDNLRTLLGDGATPDLLFVAAHGLELRKDPARQKQLQGALVCQEWPGPGTPVGREHSFSALDVSPSLDVHGLLMFAFACYGAGTPRFQDFSPLDEEPAELAPAPFTSALPKKLLAHPEGGALAVVGHVERAWSYSFSWRDDTAYTQAFEDTLVRLLGGHPVGSALECMADRHAELAVDLQGLLEEVGDRAVDEDQLVWLWATKNDARNYVLLGDPAVRIVDAAAGVPG